MKLSPIEILICGMCITGCQEKSPPHPFADDRYHDAAGVTISSEITGKLEDGSTVACYLSGTIGRPSSEIDAVLKITRADGGTTPVHAMHLVADSKSLWKSEIDYPLEIVEPRERIVIEQENQVTVVRIPNVFRTGRDSRRDLPTGGHVISIHVSINNGKLIPLDGALGFKVLSYR